MTDRTVADRTAIRDLVEGWVVWRDSGRWDRLATCWHDDAIMSATWQQASAADFIAASRAAWDRGVDVEHFLGGMTIDLVGDRAVVQTKMTIGQRATVHATPVDVVCEGRFYDFVECRAGRWAIVWRQPIYERDRMDAVAPGTTLVLDPEVLDRFPVGYRHLAYLQTAMGMTVKTDMPGRTGPEVEELYRRGTAWLAGAVGHPAGVGYG